MNKVSLKGVIIGGVVDIVTTNVFSLPVVFYVATKIQANHVPMNQLQSEIVSVIHGNPLLFSIQAVIGVGCSVLGGYVAARLAKKSEGLNGALSAWLCVGIGVYSLFSGVGYGSIVLRLADFVVAPVAGFCGGYLFKKTKRERAGEA